MRVNNEEKNDIANISFIINLSFLPGEKLLKERFAVDPHYIVKF